MKRTCANCKFLGKNPSKLNEYMQSVFDEDRHYTCESKQGFTDTWAFGNPKSESACGGKYYEKAEKHADN